MQLWVNTRKEINFFLRSKIWEKNCEQFIGLEKSGSNGNGYK